MQFSRMEFLSIILLLLATLTVGETEEEDSDELAELKADVSALWDKVKALEEEVKVHCHHRHVGPAWHRGKEIPDEVLHHEHEVHHMHQGHQDHDSHHNEDALKNLNDDHEHHFVHHRENDTWAGVDEGDHHEPHDHHRHGSSHGMDYDLEEHHRSGEKWNHSGHYDQFTDYDTNWEEEFHDRHRGSYHRSHEYRYHRGGHHGSRGKHRGHQGQRQKSHRWFSAHCRLEPNVEMPESEVSGFVKIYQKPDQSEPMNFDIHVDRVNTSLGRIHGFHIHEKAVTDGRCSSAGGHFNPLGVVHGGPASTVRHVGDLGNVMVDYTGSLHGYVIQDAMTSYAGRNSIISRSIVLHAGKDDLGTGNDEGSRATGNAGPRLACCTIEADYIPTKKDVRFRFKG